MAGPSEEQETFLPYELNYIPEDLQRRAKDELFEDEETRTNSLKLLRSRLKDEPDLHWQDDELLLLAFLRARKFDVKRTLNLIRTFYTVKSKRHELYYNYNFEDVKRSLEENTFGFLPYRDSEGCVIYVIRTQYWNPDVNTMGDHMRALTSGLLHAVLSPATQIAGIKVLFDFGGITLNHLPHISPTYLLLFAEALQNCFPARFRAVHMVNEGAFFSYVWVVLRQFLTKKLRGRFHFHRKNVKGLHKYFSPKILPAEYGGELPHYDNTEWAKLVKDKADFIIRYFSYGYQKYN